MGTRILRIILGFLLVAVFSMGSSLVGTASADTAGTVHFLGFADSTYDQFTSNPTTSTQEWFGGHMWRMVVFSPYFDSRTSWYSNGWVYDDSYAIYRGSSLTSEHPEWILKDAAGNPLYIPSGCSGGTCPQYAGDISNPEFRQNWINELKSEVAHGYKGVFVDDVNMEMQVSNGQEQIVAPIDNSTDKPMTSDQWRGYMAQFMEEVRAQLPKIEIAHNVIWFAHEHAGISNPSIRAEIESANYIFLERGVNDSGLTGGTGPWSVNALLSFVDQVHSLGRHVVLDGTASDTQGLTYNLASYFLVSNGQDAVRGGGQTPTNWWTGWNVSLGEATGSRYEWSNLLRRDFTDGTVLVNPPGSPTQTVSLSSPMQDIDGNTITSVTLPGGSGAILRDTSSASSTSELTAPPPTEAIVESAPVGTPTAPPPSSGTSESVSGSSTSTSGIETTLSTPRPTPLLRKRSHKPSRHALRARAARTRHARRHARMARHHVR
jgi:hypothetical protein